MQPPSASSGSIWSLAVLLSILFSYRVTYVLQSPVMTGIIRGIAMHLNLLLCYVVTSVLQSPIMTGVIWGIAAVTSLPLASSPEGAPRWILGVIITGLGFIPATAESIQLPTESSSATDIHPQVLSSPFIALVVCLVIASLFFFLALVYMIKKVETNPDFFVKDPFKLQVTKRFIAVFLSVTFVCLCFTSTGY